MLVRLLYASRAVDGITDTLVHSIVESSQKNNAKHGLTGILCVQPEHNVFLQVLEGGRTAVNAMYTKIARDPRHHDVTLLGFEEIQQRRFGSWRMGTVDLKRINASTVLRFSESAVLDPFSMSGSTVMTLLDELVETAAIVSR